MLKRCIRGNGAVRTDHDPGLAAFLDDTSRERANLLFTAHIDKAARLLVKSADHRFAVEVFLALGKRHRLHMDRPVDDLRRIVPVCCKVVLRAVIAADVQDLHISQFVRRIQDLDLGMRDVLLIFHQRDHAFGVVDGKIDAIHLPLRHHKTHHTAHIVSQNLQRMHHSVRILVKQFIDRNV